MLKAITFDFWNTLFLMPRGQHISSKRVEAFNKEMRDMGYNLDDELLRRTFFDCWSFAHQYQVENGLDITPIGHVNYILEKFNLKLEQPEWDRAYMVYTSALTEYPPELNQGVEETLPVLAEKYKLAVICNTGATPGSVLRDFMKANRIYSFFEVLVFSDEVSWAKPNKKIFDYTLMQLGVNSSEAAHIGDDGSTDVAGAKKAGMTAIWLAPKENGPIPDYDLHVRSINELTTLFAE